MKIKNIKAKVAAKVAKAVAKTASKIAKGKVKVAAKTGTAENSGSDHTTFICYAPFDKPQVAVAVVLENGVRGTYSMQVARDLLDAYFGFRSTRPTPQQQRD